MRKLFLLSLLSALLLLGSCDVHEFPDMPEQMTIRLALSYQTEFTPWNHLYTQDEEVYEVGTGTPYQSRREYGNIRYIIRAYPYGAKSRAVDNYTHQWIVTRDIVDGYESQFDLALPTGEYNIMVWSDLYDGQNPYYDATNFAEITLTGDQHYGSNDYRDAFRGVSHVNIIPDNTLHEPQLVEIEMQRPMARFEFITEDVVEFAEKEAIRIAAKSEGTKADPTRINIEDYKVVFYYNGFVASAYSMHDDTPAWSETGILFHSSLKKLTEERASVGFDLIFVNGKPAEVTLQIGVYDNQGEEVSLTNKIEVPLKRNRNTILTGNFLMSKAAGGVTINPGYHDDYNIIF